MNAAEFAQLANALALSAVFGISFAWIGAALWAGRS